MTFEQHREAEFQSIAMELQTVQYLKEHLLSFLGLRDLQWRTKILGTVT